MVELTEGSVVLCTVKKIEKATIFLDIEDDGEGSMILSEVAAGRIRNLREYVTPNKKVVCKILKIKGNHIHLSLRRVTGKEREEVLERHKKEKSLLNMLKTITQNPEEKIEKIKQEYDILDFLEEARDNSEILKNFFPKEEAEKIESILKEKIEKEKKVIKIIKLNSYSPTGLSDIKEILKTDNAEIKYLGSSRFTIETQAKNFKEANKKLSLSLGEIEKKAKEKHALLEIQER